MPKSKLEIEIDLSKFKNELNELEEQADRVIRKIETIKNSGMRPIDSITKG